MANSPEEQDVLTTPSVSANLSLSRARARVCVVRGTLSAMYMYVYSFNQGPCASTQPYRTKL